MISGTLNSSTQNTAELAQKPPALLQHQPETLTHNIRSKLSTDKINSPQHVLSDPCMIQLETIAENTEVFNRDYFKFVSPQYWGKSMTCTKRSRGKKSEDSEKCTNVNLKNEEKVKSPKNKKTREENYEKSFLTQSPKTFNKELFTSRRKRRLWKQWK